MRWMLSLPVVLLLVACQPGKDTRPPVINWPFPADKASLTTGDTLVWQAVVVDNQLLDSLFVTLVPAFEKPASVSFMPDAVTYTEVEALGGDTRLWTYGLIIPDSALAGTYTGSLEVVDAAGNRSRAEKSWTLRNALDGENPVIDSVFCPDSLRTADVATFFVSAGDNERLAFAQWDISRVATDSLVTSVFLPMDTNADSAQFPWQGAAVLGQYRIRLTVGDWVNNRTQRTCNLLIYQ